jgi:hypothetical protein
VENCGTNSALKFLPHALLVLVFASGYAWIQIRKESPDLLLPPSLPPSFSPFLPPSYRWSMFSSFKRFLQVIVLLLVTLLMELNAFMLLHTLQIPKNSAFNKTRLSLGTRVLAFPPSLPPSLPPSPPPMSYLFFDFRYRWHTSPLFLFPDSFLHLTWSLLPSLLPSLPPSRPPCLPCSC